VDPRDPEPARDPIDGLHIHVDPTRARARRPCRFERTHGRQAVGHYQRCRPGGGTQSRVEGDDMFGEVVRAHGLRQAAIAVGIRLERVYECTAPALLNGIHTGIGADVEDDPSFARDELRQAICPRPSKAPEASALLLCRASTCVTPPSRSTWSRSGPRQRASAATSRTSEARRILRPDPVRAAGLPQTAQENRGIGQVRILPIVITRCGEILRFEGCRHGRCVNARTRPPSQSVR
jgi:hypothetical protein